jgi:hypothetical protein
MSDSDHPVHEIVATHNTYERIPTPIAPTFLLPRGNTSNPSHFPHNPSLQAAAHRGLPNLPSPISEDITSPSVVMESLSLEADVAMQDTANYEPPQLPLQPPTPPSGHESKCSRSSSPVKKGHERMRHSLRAWGSFLDGDEDGGGGGGGGAGPPGLAPGGAGKRGFSMGYRADCERCRMKVPGHFSHVVSYRDLRLADGG